MKTQGEDGPLRAKERGLGQIHSSQLRAGTNPANTFVDLGRLASRTVGKEIAVVEGTQPVLHDGRLSN